MTRSVNRDLIFYVFGGLTGFIAGLFLGLSAAGAVDCIDKPDLSTPGPVWRYRVIDERRCWYRGEAVLAKSELAWRRPELDMAFNALKPVLVKTVSYRPELSESNVTLAVFAGLGFAIVIAGLLWPLRRRA